MRFHYVSISEAYNSVEVAKTPAGRTSHVTLCIDSWIGFPAGLWRALPQFQRLVGVGESVDLESEQDFADLYFARGLRIWRDSPFTSTTMRWPLKRVFLSYSSKNEQTAVALHKALEDLNWEVWRDESGIRAGDIWAAAIDAGLQGADALVILVTPDSAQSQWVTYEYAFATGARVPVVAATIGLNVVPDPIRRFQIVPYTGTKAVGKIHDGLINQVNKLRKTTGRGPVLIAKFWEDENGELWRKSRHKVPEIAIELWVDNAPSKTEKVTFEILADVEDAMWTVKRTKRPSIREFLTNDISLWGDVDIVARGMGKGKGEWTAGARLYDSLLRYYDGKRLTQDARNALEQIREN